MVTLALAVIAYLRALFVPRHKLALEAAALRQQLAVFKRKHPRPELRRLDRLFWIALRRLWSGWTEALIMVKPETVVSWRAACKGDHPTSESPVAESWETNLAMRR